MNPPEKERLPASPEEWLVHAKSDLKLARLGKESKDVLPQQAVEKSFKAVLLLNKIDFPLTHDIEELIDIFEGSNISLPSEMLEASILTPYAVETRYPGYWDEIAKDDVNEAITLAEKVILWAEGKITYGERVQALK